MAESLTNTPEVKQLLNRAAGLDQPGGNERLKRIVQRVATDMCRIIEEFDVTPTEFWAAVGYVTRLGQANEVGLLVPGLGVETFLDVVMDEKERRAGLEGGTPRTIEGPLYITDAPLERGEARLDQDPEEGEVLFVEGQVRDTKGTPVPGAIVDVWHANTKGFYSFFDPTPTPQSPYNLRRRIETDAEGRYRFRTIMPSGYGCPPDGPTQQLLDRLGRHGKRPAHVHFFVEAPGFRKLTTQINIADDPLPARRLRFRHPRRADPGAGPPRRPGGDQGARTERALRHDHLRLRAEPGSCELAGRGRRARARQGRVIRRGGAAPLGGAARPTT